MQMNHQLMSKMHLIVFFLITFLFVGFLPVSQVEAITPPTMFTGVDTDSSGMDYQSPAHVSRTRCVNVNVNLLFDANGDAIDKTDLPEISLNLFPDVNYTGVVTSVKKENIGISWIGKLKDRSGYFYMVVTDGVFIAHVASTDGVYEVSSAGKKVYHVEEIDQSQLIDCHPGELAPSGDILPEGDLSTDADTGSTIDVMVVYTTAARLGEGSTAAMKARIALAMTETNTSYANSSVVPRLRLVHVEEVSYTESGDISIDLSRLVNSGDGYMDQVHSRRNTYGADMVSLVVENGGGYCGMASSILSTAANAFQVTARSGCMTGYYSFGHEFGHLQGARHDTYVDNSTTPYTYGHGYVYTPSRWRTVMAYNNKCTDTSPYTSCTRLQYWSNPTKFYGGVAMGNSTAKNYMVLNNTRTTIANFRSAKIGSDFNSTFNGSSSGWSAVKGVWSLYNSAYYRSLGLANTGASAKYNATYGDLTYEARMKRTGVSSLANRIIIRGNPNSLDSTNWWKPSYFFQYSNDGTFSVYEMSSGGVSTALKGWTAHAAIVKNEWNTLKVVAVGSSLKFYINGTLVWSGSDATLKTGQVGLGFYRDSNAGILSVDWAKLSTTPTADPAADMNEIVAPGEEIEGGSINVSP